MKANNNLIAENMDANLNADVRDRLGSTVAVTDSEGKLVQATGYYPSGTPYQIPDATLATDVDAKTERLHIGNRWIGHKGIDLYDNTARMHDPLLARYHTPDPLFTNYPGQSPWSHCAANPINFIDPSGKTLQIIGECEHAFSELEKEVQGVNLNMNHEGIITYTLNTKKLTEIDKRLIEVIDDDNIKVHITAQNNKYLDSGELFIGGAFGSKVYNQQLNTVIAYQTKILLY